MRGSCFMEKFFKLKENGTTVILITHDTDIAATAERIIRISDGRITYDGPKEGAGL